MTAFTNTWNAANRASPADGDALSAGAGKIRDFKLDFDERMQVDHSMAGDAEDGTHLKVTFTDPLAVKPTQELDNTYLYTKDVSSTSELFFEDESGNEVQLTAGGAVTLNINDLTAKTTLVDADHIAITDSAASDVDKKITWANVKSELQTELAATETVVGMAELLTDAEFVTGTDSTRTIVASNFIKLAGANGHIKLPGGITVQWGLGGGANTGTITFPVAFTTACRSVVAMIDIAGGGNGMIVNVDGAPSTTGWNWSQRSHAGASPSLNFYWIAIGD